MKRLLVGDMGAYEPFHRHLYCIMTRKFLSIIPTGADFLFQIMNLSRIYIWQVQLKVFVKHTERHIFKRREPRFIGIWKKNNHWLWLHIYTFTHSYRSNKHTSIQYVLFPVINSLFNPTTLRWIINFYLFGLKARSGKRRTILQPRIFTWSPLLSRNFGTNNDDLAPALHQLCITSLRFTTRYPRVNPSFHLVAQL